jgi:hypothetical protein
MSESKLLCTVCKEQKKEYRTRQSKLLPGLQLFLCGECFDGKKEPRFAIIMAGRTMGVAAVRDYLRNHRYVGKELKAEEFV